MNPNQLCIRPVLPQDNQMLAGVIREVLIEMGVPEEGTTLADDSLGGMYETYQLPRSSYWVVSDASGLWGGGGIAPLEGADSSICELQKMYFSRALRRLGWGDRLMRKALASARAFGYERMYLETMPNMEAAQKLYRGHGFQYLDHPLGNTGHTACTVWMAKEFKQG